MTWIIDVLRTMDDDPLIAFIELAAIIFVMVLILRGIDRIFNGC